LDTAVFPSEANALWHPAVYPWHTAKMEVPPIWWAPWEFTATSLGAGALSDERIRRVFGAYQMLVGTNCFVNKSVMISFMLDKVLERFPDGRLIHIVRDGRAVAWSYATRERQKMLQRPALYARRGIPMDPQSVVSAMARYWRDHVAEVRRQDSRLGLTDRGVLIELKYEDLCERPSAELARLAGFIGVDPRRYVGDVAEGSITESSRWRSAVQPASSVALRKIMEPWLSAFGYVR
jgi:hypothetical protein